MSTKRRLRSTAFAPDRESTELADSGLNRRVTRRTQVRCLRAKSTPPIPRCRPNDHPAGNPCRCASATACVPWAADEPASFPPFPDGFGDGATPRSIPFPYAMASEHENAALGCHDELLAKVDSWIEDQTPVYNRIDQGGGIGVIRHRLADCPRAVRSLPLPDTVQETPIDNPVSPGSEPNTPNLRQVNTTLADLIFDQAPKARNRRVVRST